MTTKPELIVHHLNQSRSERICEHLKLGPDVTASLTPARSLGSRGSRDVFRSQVSDADSECLLQELNVPYSVKVWYRDPQTAPQGLKDVYPLGKVRRIK